jgi:short-subunit dehydrogenase
MKKLALITGASSGIGRELVRIHASTGGDLILVARRMDDLEILAKELREKYHVEVIVVMKDLSIPGAAKALVNELREHIPDVEFLINNAGFGGFGKFHERPIEREIEMMQLNMIALTELTHLLLPHMISKNYGRILNVASTAGFMPGPLQSVYFATKAYVVSFSQGIHHELKRQGISVTALCPGPVRTEFEKTAGLEGVDLFKRALSPVNTAKAGYQGMLKGKMIVFDQLSLSFSINWLIPFIPRNWVLRMIEKMQTPKGS